MNDDRDERSRIGGLRHRMEVGFAGLVFSFAIGSTLLLSWSIHRPRPEQPGGVVTAADRDGDGIDDGLERALLERHAPIAVLSDEESAWPSSVAWVRDRVPLVSSGPTFRGTVIAAAAFAGEVRQGSERTADWTVYGHAYRRRDGGIELQYWFYYPFNDGHLFFDHESDWEHVSVELDASGRPSAFAAAAHHDNAPGSRTAWAEVSREGERPLFFVATGTHAAYAQRDDAPFWERMPAEGRERRWRVGENGSRLVNVGERGRPLGGRTEEAFFVEYPGLWGAAVPVFGSSAPMGPPFQRAFCVDSRADSCR